MTTGEAVAIPTGHAPGCVCGHCSSVRRECQWPPGTTEGERWGHDWVGGPIMTCTHCDERAIFKIVWVQVEGDKVPLTVHLVLKD